MKKDKFAKLISLLKQELIEEQQKTTSQWHDSEFGIRLIDLLIHASIILKDHEFFLSTLIKTYKSSPGREFKYTFKNLDYIETLLDISSEYDEVKEYKFLQEASDKLKEAGLSFDNQDYTSVINNLNSSLELALKDELDIPKTISKINTRKILDICIAENIGPVAYLKELIKHVLELDNKVKHQGYSPSKLDCINAITATEDFMKKVNQHPFKLSEDAKRKVFSGL